VLLAANESAGHPQLITAALVGIAVVVVLISVVKVHPFLSLVIGSGVLGVVAGLGLDKTISGFENGVGATVGSVGLLIALGAMIGGLLADSGGADRIVRTVVAKVSHRGLPWAMAGLAALIGLPLFFEVGVVLLVPVVLLIARRTETPVLRIGIPALAGLSVLHGLVPPHPGPLAAISALKADLGETLAFGLLIAIPTVIICGPVFALVISRYVHVETPATWPGSVVDDEAADDGARADDGGGSGDTLVQTKTKTKTMTNTETETRADRHRLPGIWSAVLTILLPVTLMLIRAVGELTLDSGDGTRKVLDEIGNPIIALLAGVLAAMYFLGYGIGYSRDEVSRSLGNSLPPIAGILLIVAAGGGFKQVLLDAGVGQMIADFAKDASLSPLLLGWLVAVGIRVSTGSATVATITAAGIVAPLAATLDKPTVALLALAVGSGSLFFSHVNDAGFWLVKEYFGMSIKQTLLSWSLMETLISVVGFAGVLALNLVV
jgi:GntP family gluconate:H+ symporter